VEVKVNENDFEKIDGMIARRIGTFADSIQHKLDLVVEGHQMLSEKLDRVEARLDQRIDGLERKICEVDAGLSREIKELSQKVNQAETTLSQKMDAVATDLKEHRADTEAHNKIYKVKEE
jgi:hypothetical protein